MVIAKQVVLLKKRAAHEKKRPAFFHERAAQKRPRAWDVFLSHAFFLSEV